jgi:hypothetical protein
MPNFWAAAPLLVLFPTLSPTTYNTVLYFFFAHANKWKQNACVLKLQWSDSTDHWTFIAATMALLTLQAFSQSCTMALLTLQAFPQSCNEMVRRLSSSHITHHTVFCKVLLVTQK